MDLRALKLLLTLAIAGAPAGAQTPAKPETVRDPTSRPSFATARCIDGTFWTSTQRAGACLGHGGVIEWLPPDWPKDATARCADLTWSSSNEPQSACVQHGGVRVWLGRRLPPNATALCGDGTYWTSPETQGACLGHAGMFEWYGGPGGQLPVKN